MKRLLGDEIFVKRYIKYVTILAGIAAALTLSLAVHNRVFAEQPGQVGNAPRCTVESIGPRGTAFKVQGHHATVDFRVFGPNNCKVQVSTMAFYAPSITGRPYDQQILFDKNTRTYTPGRYTLGINIPERSTERKGCFYQLDLTYGTRIHSPVLAYGHGRLNCEKPTAKCEGIDKNKISRNEFSFVGRASADGGASIRAYTFTARNSNGRIVAEKTIRTDARRANSGKMTFNQPGQYTVRLTVKTSVGDKSGPQCVTQITVNETPPPPPPKTPGVSVTKKVNNQENVIVGVNQIFTYQIVVKNTGNTVLKDVAVRDRQPNGVTFISASAGTITNGEWRHTIDRLNIGESKSFTITAKIPVYLAGTIKNTVCVDAPSVPGNPDDCDDAHVRVPQPQAACVVARTNYINTTDFTLFGKAATRNGAQVTSYVFTIKNAAGQVVKTETVTSNTLQVTTPTLSLQTPGTYSVNLVVKTSVGDRTGPRCNTSVVIPQPNMVQVCDPQTGQIITVPEDQAGNYLPPNDPRCQPPEQILIDVCELSTKNIITINEQDFNPNLHSRDMSQCDEPGTPETPEQPGKGGPEALVDTGVGAVFGAFASITAGGALAHRLVWMRRYL
jgi:uncharacterized repeat protein (TIGR01451 family)